MDASVKYVIGKKLLHPNAFFGHTVHEWSNIYFFITYGTPSPYKACWEPIKSKYKEGKEHLKNKF